MNRGACRLLLVLVLLSIGVLCPWRTVFGQPPGGRTEGKTAQAQPQRQAEENKNQQGRYGRTPPDLVPYGRSVNPYRLLYLAPPLFRGPGRDRLEPAGLESVRIGLIAPLEGVEDAWAGTSLKRGVELAMQEANESGGYGGLAFELVVRNDRPLWGSSANTLVELAYEHRVWAIIGSIDSNSTHVALRAAFKAEVPIVNVGSSDPTVTETGIPWIIRCTPDDRQTGYRLAQLLFEEEGLSRVAVFRARDRYGRLGVREFRDAARRLSHPLLMEVQFVPGETDFASQLSRIAAADPEAVVLWARAAEAGRIVRQMRDRGMLQRVVGTDRLVSETFLELAGAAAEGVVATAWARPDRDDPEWVRFRQRFRTRFGVEPDVFAAYGYDAANLVVIAVRQAGLNRARIRDALAAVRTYEGVTGTMRFDATSNNVSGVLLARVEGGRFVFD